MGGGMPELFSNDWIDNYKAIWNSDEGIVQELKRHDFDSVVAFGVDGEEVPRVVLTVSKGKLLSVKPRSDQSINWDLRASLDTWHALTYKPPSLMRLGLAYTTRKLKFKRGDYGVMVKDPYLSTAFVKCFALMGKAII